MTELKDITMVDWARAQFALTAMYHWLFVPLTLGLSWLIEVILPALKNRVIARIGCCKCRRLGGRGNCPCTRNGRIPDGIHGIDAICKGAVK